VLYWGTSEWSGAQIAAAVGTARQYNLYPPQAEQPQYNLLVRERVEKEILPVVQANGIGLTTFSPLATGLLSGKYDDGLPEGSRLARESSLRDRWYSDKPVAQVRKLAPIAEELGINRAQLALAWLLHKPGVSSVITGATSRAQLENNVQAVDVSLSAEVMARIEAAVA
jgi:aryl-alcohol dehydrogenase-like predicted oxidoreductase